MLSRWHGFSTRCRWTENRHRVCPFFRREQETARQGRQDAKIAKRSANHFAMGTSVISIAALLLCSLGVLGALGELGASYLLMWAHVARRHPSSSIRDSRSHAPNSFPCSRQNLICFTGVNHTLEVRMRRFTPWTAAL